MSLQRSIEGRGKDETNSNADKNMRAYLSSMKNNMSSCMKKGLCSVYEKITKR